jgi:hypothetical protein
LFQHPRAVFERYFIRLRFVHRRIIEQLKPRQLRGPFHPGGTHAGAKYRIFQRLGWREA